MSTIADKNDDGGDNDDDDQDSFDRRITDLVLLAAMYPGQVLLDDDHLQTAVVVEQDVSAKVDEQGEDISGLFHLKNELQTLEVAFILPPKYPKDPARLHCRIQDDSAGSACLRGRQKKLNEAVCKKIGCKEDVEEEFSLIEAVQEVLRLWEDEEFQRPKDEIEEEAETKVPNEGEVCRYWIYSHHIKSKTKRRLIVQLAEQLQLNGLMLIGKPGIIVIEGRRPDCETWWTQIRALTWQRISLIDTEINCSIVFEDFSEQTDRSAVFRLLQAKNCDTVLRSFLGLSSKDS